MFGFGLVKRKMNRENARAFWRVSRTEGYERIAERATELSDTRPVYVADREADISAGACHGISGRLVAPGQA